jgi:hypothetical protein
MPLPIKNILFKIFVFLSILIWGIIIATVISLFFTIPIFEKPVKEDVLKEKIFLIPSTPQWPNIEITEIKNGRFSAFFNLTFRNIDENIWHNYFIISFNISGDLILMVQEENKKIGSIKTSLLRTNINFPTRKNTNVIKTFEGVDIRSATLSPSENLISYAYIKKDEPNKIFLNVYNINTGIDQQIYSWEPDWAYPFLIWDEKEQSIFVAPCDKGKVLRIYLNKKIEEVAEKGYPIDLSEDGKYLLNIISLKNGKFAEIVDMKKGEKKKYKLKNLGFDVCGVKIIDENEFLYISFTTGLAGLGQQTCIYKVEINGDKIKEKLIAKTSMPIGYSKIIFYKD